MPELTAAQHSILVGTLLGDANLQINKGCRNAYFKLVHGPKQLEYLKWKGSVFSSYFNTLEPYSWDNKWGTSYQLRTRALPVFTKYHTLFYSRPREECRPSVFPKKVTEEILSYVDELALAIWYCDDGSPNVEKGHWRNSMTLALGGMEEAEYSMIEAWFKNIVPKVKRKECPSNCVVLKFGVDGSEVLANKIYKHIPPSMQYKIKDIELEVPHS